MRLITDLRNVLNQSQKRRYAALQSYFLFAALFQVVSVASIAPFIAILSNPQLIREHWALNWLYRFGEFQSDRAFLVSFATLLMILIFLGNAIPAVSGYLSWRFVRRLMVEIQADVYRGFVYSDLAKTARMNTAQMTNVVTEGVNRLIYNVVLPLLSLVSNGFVILFIALGLVVYDPSVALVAMLVVGGGYAVMFVMAKKRLSHHGAIWWYSREEKQRLMTESLRGLKEIRLAGAEPYYENRLHDLTSQSLRSEARVALYSDLPRFALETIALCSLLMLGVYLLLRNERWSTIVAVLSVYAMAGYRLLPAAQVVFRAAATLKANSDVVRDVTRDVKAGRALLNVSDEQTIEFSSSSPLIVTDLSFRYPEEERNVLSNVNAELPRNAITALVGPSGAGKSTFADVLMGLVSPLSGQVTVGGISIHAATRSWQQSVCLVSQSVFLMDDTVRANIIFGSNRPIDEERLRAAAVMAHALAFIEELPGGFDCKIGEAGGRLSGGQRQRIGIARALYNEADVIVMDEPTSALDAFSEREVMSAIVSLKGKKTILLVTHRLQPLRDADHIIVLDEGKIVGAGAYPALLITCPQFRELVETTG